jgi:hypothetical protein
MTSTWTVSLPVLIIGVADLLSCLALSFRASGLRTRRARILGFWLSVAAGVPGAVIVSHLAMYGFQP